MFCIRKTHAQQLNHGKSWKLLLQTLLYEKYLFLSRNNLGNFLFLPLPFSPQVPDSQNGLGLMGLACRVLGEFWTRLMNVLVFYPCVLSRPLKTYILPSGIILGCCHNNAHLYQQGLIKEMQPGIRTRITTGNTLCVSQFSRIQEKVLSIF